MSKRIYICIKNSEEFKKFLNVCNQMKQETGESPRDCIGVGIDLTKGFVLNCPEDLSEKWIAELKKFG